MTDTTKEANGGAVSGSDRSFALQSIHLKDLSFESPNTPGKFGVQLTDPDVQMNLKNAHKVLANNIYEVSLQISIHAKADDKSIFLVEIDQGGMFQIKGYSPEETKMILGTYCPASLFPYARELVSSLVGKGGYPPLVLQHINFDALYANAQKPKGDDPKPN